MSGPRRSQREPRTRGELVYDKPPKSLDALADQLADRGLTLPNRDRTIRYLRHIGYFRLSPYTIPFQHGGPDHLIRAGTTFDDVLDLYVFDRALRLLVMDALERVEVAVRAALTDHMSTTYEDAHWYTSASHFRDRGKHRGLLKIVGESVEKKLQAVAEPTGASAAEDTDQSEATSLVHRSALEHYVMTYSSPELPPSWLMVETLTIGQLTNAYKNLKRRSDRTAVAASIGLTATILESWMMTYVRVRNICAHHGRLWNVGLGVYPKIPSTPSIPWLAGEDAFPERSEKRLYPVLVSLQSILETVSPGSSWAIRLHQLISTRPEMNLRGMGIPDSWSDDEFWSRRIK